jgi:hypothetical protein
MAIVIEPLPENERQRRDIQEQVDKYLSAGGRIQSLGVTQGEGLKSRREMNDQVGRTMRGPKTNT